MASAELQALAKYDEAGLIPLLNLVQSSITDILSHYKAIDTPLRSLDNADPKPGPFEKVENTPPTLQKAIRVLQGACGQLSQSVASPTLTLSTRVLGFWEVSALHVATAAKIADHLDGKAEGLHVNELAKLTGLDANNISRVLRVLTIRHIFKETNPNVFANNKLSIRLRSSESVSNWIYFCAMDCMKVAPELYNSISNKKGSESAFERVFKKANLYQYLGSPEGAETLPVFTNAMIGMGESNGKSMLARVYPWNKFSTSHTITVCDVGGSTGHVVLSLMQLVPSRTFKGIIQDSPEMLAEAQTFWMKERPEAIEKENVEFVPINFFEDAVVPGCDFYYMRYILHNWPDEACVKILSNVAKGMKDSKETSRLLVHDFVLHPSVPSSNESAVKAGEHGFPIGPSPLLSNFGMGSSFGYDMDLNMMGFLGAKDRTFDELVEIGAKAGFKFENVYVTGTMDIMEFSLI